MKFKVLTGGELAPYLPALIQMRLSIFREFPYFYEGTEENEVRYLSHIIDCNESQVALALEGDHIVGAITSLPLSHTVPELKCVFEKEGLDPAKYYYLSEAMIEKKYRGSHLVFRMLRMIAKRRNPKLIPTLCMIDSREDHNLHAFVKKRGFKKHPELSAQIAWKEVGNGEVNHTMTFWIGNRDTKLF